MSALSGAERVTTPRRTGGCFRWRRLLLLGAWAGLGALGCTGSIVGATNSPNNLGNSGGSAPTSGPVSGHAAGSDNLGASAGSSGNAGNSGAGGLAPFSTTLLPVRVRRLTNAEIDASVQTLLGTKQSFAVALVAQNLRDIRQKTYAPNAGFTRNADAVIDSLTAAQFQVVADSIAAEAVSARLATIAPCSDSNQDNCAIAFIKTFGASLFRGPVSAEAVAGLTAVYHTGMMGQDYAAGIQLALSTMIQSADFLYLTELGDGEISSNQVALTSHEVASQLSYLVTGGPPDPMLLSAAGANELQDPTNVATHAQRLLGTDSAKKQLATFVQQWVGIDSPTGSLQASMVNETTGFIIDVFAQGDGSLGSMLTSTYSFVDAPLASLYGLPAPSGSGMSRVELNNGRRGILNQASFLSTYAHADASAPIRRGHVLRTFFLCQDIPPPDPSIKADTSVPTPTTSQTTRQAADARTRNGPCGACHSLMNPMGYAFEHFDGAGAYRSTDNGQVVDDSGALTATDSIDGPFANGDELLQKLATSNEVAQCYARNFFRFASAQSSDATEATFLNFMRQQSTASLSNAQQLLIAFVKTDLFLKRRAQ
jgi:hypothetical protein